MVNKSPELTAFEREDLARWWLGRQEGNADLPTITDGTESYSNNDIADAIRAGITREQREWVRMVLAMRNTSDAGDTKREVTGPTYEETQEVLGKIQYGSLEDDDEGPWANFDQIVLQDGPPADY